MKLSDIKPGMTIEYRGRVYGHRNLIGKDKTKTGIIKQVTPNLIAVQGQRYPDTILVNDLLSGQVKIISLKKEEHMSNPVGKPKREPPAKEKLQQAFEKHEGKIKPIATEFKTGWAQARNWLIEAGIIDSDYVYQKQTPTLEPEQAANQEPEREKVESATQSVAQEEPEITVKDVLMCETAQREQGFGPEDDEPIPYQVAEDATLDGMKVIWIENVLTHCTQAKTQLQYIQAIMDLRV